MKKTLASVILLVLGCSPPAGTPASPQAPASTGQSEELVLQRAAGLRAHLEFLADDLLEGRGTGTRGYEVAARYSISQLIAAGTEPAGDAGRYLQAVPLRESKIAKSSFVIHTGGKSQQLKWVDEFIVSPSHLETRQNVRAAVVYAGFGIVSTEFGIDDYMGLDVRGKIVLLLLGGHAQLPSEPRAHHSSRTEKAKTAAKLGAVGVVFVHSLQMERRFPWEKLKHFAEKPSMTWLGTSGEPFVEPANSSPMGALSPSIATALFSAAGGTSFETIRADADANPARVAGFELPMEFEIAIETSHARVESANVAAVLPGTDPTLRDQVVVVSAHLDHLGIGEPKDGDPIHNGALDNASGSAMVLELAHAMKTIRPKRSVLFLLVTAEEKGLIGSDFFARNPSTSKTMVANINLDLVFWETGTKKLVFYGEQNSSLGPLARRLATESGYDVIADPFPEKGYFTRSDHYSFVKQGVPALFLGSGFDNDGAAALDYTKNHYHQVSDQLGPIVVDYREGAKLVLLMADLLAAIGNDQSTPSWAAGNFFTKLYGPASP